MNTVVKSFSIISYASYSTLPYDAVQMVSEEARITTTRRANLANGRKRIPEFSGIQETHIWKTELML